MAITSVRSEPIRLLEGLGAAVLEDDPGLSAAMQAWLAEAGARVASFGDGNALVKAARRDSFDFFLLDWQVPGMTGDQVLRALREDLHVGTPVIFVTARHSEDDVESVLQAGADDFLVKPVRRRELLARVKAVLRRSRPRPEESVLGVGRYRFELVARRLRVGDASVELSEKEFDLAAFLFARAGELVSRGHIAQAVWGHDELTVSRTLDIHVSRLRRKLALGPENGARLSTVYGYGYRLEEVRDEDVAS